MPAYWQKAIADKTSDGFALIGLDGAGADKEAWHVLKQLMKQTNGDHLGYGADHHGYPPYDRLKLKCAWRLEHPALWHKYTGAQQAMLRDLTVLRRSHAARHPGLPPKTANVASALPGGTHADVNEAILTHGAPPDVLLSILANGLNERFSGSNAGTAYGGGTYFAEDVGKNDQYVAVDSSFDGGSELHKRLYGHGVQHPGKVFYLLVCRVALGHHVRTSQYGEHAKSMDSGVPLFPISFRELAAVP
eukprot:5917136-Prymnesium_polylepis.1